MSGSTNQFVEGAKHEHTFFVAQHDLDVASAAWQYASDALAYSRMQPQLEPEPAPAPESTSQVHSFKPSGP